MTPLEQAGWPGTIDEWRQSRRVIFDGIQHSGDILDIGCANGLLLEQLVEWAQERGHTLTPHGIDESPELVASARDRFPEHAGNFNVASILDNVPPGTYDLVHIALNDIPENRQHDVIQRLLESVVAPGGRLIVSSYGSYDRSKRPVDVDLHLQFLGFSTSGCGNSMLDGGWVATRSAWIDR